MIPESIGTLTGYIDLSTMGVTKGLATARAKMETFQRRVQASGLGIIKMGVVLAAPIANATRIFAGFDDQMRLVKAVTQATADEFASLTDQSKLLGRTTSYTARQVAGGMVELGRAGFATNEIRNAIPSMLNLARATGTDLSEAANIASGTLRAFQIDASDMGRVADVMTAAANKSAQTLTDLGESMKYAAPVAKDFGLSLEETTKAISTMAQFSIRGSMAGTSLRMMMLRLSKTKVREKLRGIGVAVADTSGNIRSLTDIMQDLHGSMQTMGQADRLALLGDLFGARAVSGGIKLVNANFEELNRSIDNAGGVAKRTADEMDAGLGGSLRLLWSAVEGLNIAIGEAVEDALTPLVTAVTDALGSVARFIEKNQWIVEVLAYVAAALLSVGAGMLAFSGIAFAAGKVLGGLITIVKALGVALKFLAMNPVGLIIMAIGALIYVLYKFVLQGETVGEKIQHLGKILKAVVITVWEVWKAKFATMGLVMYSFAYSVVVAWNNIIHLFKNVIPAYMSWLGRNWKALFVDIGKATLSVLTNIGRNLKDFFHAIKRWVKGGGWSFKRTSLLDGFESSLEPLPDVAERAITSTEKAMLDGMDRMRGKMKESAESIVSAWQDAFAKESKGVPDVLRDFLMFGAPAISSAIMGAALGKGVTDAVQGLDAQTRMPPENQNRVLPGLIEEGTADAYNAVVRREEKPAKETAKNTKQSADALQRIDKKIGPGRSLTLVDLGLG